MKETIVHVITTINRGGAENQLVQMLSNKFLNKYNLVVIYLKGNGYWANFLREKGIKVYGPFFPNGNYFSVYCHLKLIKCIKRLSVSLLHLHLPASLLVFTLNKFFRNSRYPILYTQHNDEPLIPYIPFESFFGRILLIQTNKIVAISNAVKLYLAKKYRINLKKIHVIDYCFEPNNYSNQIDLKDKQFSVYDTKTIFIGTVARLTTQKRLDLLLEIFLKLKKITNSREYKLVIVGDGELKTKLKNLAIEKNIMSSIIWIPYTEKVVEHMNFWDCFCLTSEYEGLGLVLLEAIYSKLPIVAFDVSSVSKTVGKCGEIVPFGMTDEFSLKILKVIRNKKKYLYPEHLEKFSVEKNTKSHQEQYKLLLNP